MIFICDGCLTSNEHNCTGEADPTGNLCACDVVECRIRQGMPEDINSEWLMMDFPTDTLGEGI